MFTYQVRINMLP